ncbi:phage baseplate plug family protein [Phytobacter ursingii]
MTVNEIPLSPDNQQFSVALSGTTYRMRIIWRDPVWCLDLMNSDKTPLALNLPLVTGAELLAQYSYLNLGFKLAVVCDIPGQEYPTKTDLGITSHLYAVTE